MPKSGDVASQAPFFCAPGDAPSQSSAHWVHASDGVRLRIGHFGQGQKGTILCFPGRTEYVEKYARVACDLQAAGFGMLAIDWRGQGLADRLIKPALLGHVDRFSDYQLDVAAMVSFAQSNDMPKPWYLLAHSMGGAIGLRALASGLDVSAAVFSAPMWGLTIHPMLHPMARQLPAMADCIGLGHARVPLTGRQPYVLTASATNNLLTSDPVSFKWFRDHVRAHPDLALGAPTMRWLREAMREFVYFRDTPPPSLRCQIHLGRDESIVSPEAIHSLAARWPNAEVTLYDGGRHEVLMERPVIRDAILHKIVTDLFQ